MTVFFLLFIHYKIKKKIFNITKEDSKSKKLFEET